MKRVWIVVLVAATASADKAPPATACPVGAQPWARLVFPSCPGPAYHTDLPIRDDHPCRATQTLSDDSKPLVVEHSYDSSSRLIESKVDGQVIRRCSYDGDRLVACESIRTQGDGAGEVTRDPAKYDHGRLVAYGDTTIHYNDDGDADVIRDTYGSVEVTYDHHRATVAKAAITTHYHYTDDLLVGANDTRYLYRDGHIVKTDDGQDSTRFAYDKRGRLVSITSPYDTWTYAYCQ